MSFTVLVPARMASTRLPRKALADIAGLPMVVRVARAPLTRVGPGRGPAFWIATGAPYRQPSGRLPSGHVINATPAISGTLRRSLIVR